MKYLKLLSLGLLVLLFGSCLKNENLKRYTYYAPVYKTVQEVRDNVKSQAAQPIQNMGGMIVYHNYILTLEQAKGIHIIDASNLLSPTRIGFIPIPGCWGIAIRNNYLYANSYMDLFTIDINDIKNVKLTSVEENIFNEQSTVSGYAIDQDHVIVEWVKKDTTVSQEYINGHNSGGWRFAQQSGVMNFALDASSGGSAGGNSTGGSMARFTLVNDYMYAVDRAELYTLSLSNPAQPVRTDKQRLAWNIETIYPFKDKLFIGSNSGMYIFTITNPASPVQQSEFNHVSSCDPVVANDKYAFVTLRSGNDCQGFTNQMEVLNIEDIKSPQLLKIYPYTNPHGLSLSGNVLFLCDGMAGLRILDASDPMNIIETDKFAIGMATDVITLGNTAYVVTSNKIFIYEFSTAYDVTQKGTLNI